MKRAEILALQLGRRRVDTQAWGTCYVRQLRADELRELLDILDGPRGAVRLARLVVFGAVDEAGAPMFEPGDVDALTTKALEPLGALADAFLELNDIQEFDDPEKKSPSTRLSSSPSTSRTDGATRNPAH